MEGCSPFEGLRRKSGRFLPYLEEARRISSLTASSRPCGGMLHGGRLSLSGTKSATRHARNLNADTA
jgi:hypothetical protein